MPRFFVSTPIGFEHQVLEEIRGCWPQLLTKDAQKNNLPFPSEVRIEQGGLEFETETFTALQLNFFLKSANRILLRLASFKAKDLPKFYQKFKALPWQTYLQHGHVEWEVAAQRSRLNNEKRLRESASDALRELFPASEALKPCASIYIRMDEDQCTISLDTTGDHLHKRGWSVLKGEAPLRETIAAFLIQQLIEKTPLSQLSSVTLLDPMVGSGTFLCEARGLHTGHFKRTFAFQSWKNAPKIFHSESFPLNYSLSKESLFKAYRGFDSDSDMVVVAEKNFSEVEQQLRALHKKQFSPGDFKVLELNSLDPAQVAESPLAQSLEQPLWIVVNPPYGERLPEASQGGLQNLATELCRLYKPQKLGVLYPEKEKMTGVPKGYEVLRQLKVNNGGLRCLFTVLAPCKNEGLC